VTGASDPPELQAALSAAFDRDARKLGRYVPETNARVFKPSKM